MIRTGIDIVKIDRIRKLIKNPLSTEKIFADSEKSNSIETLAGYFAAKEAFFKAAGIRVEHWNEVVVKKKKTGKPYLVFDKDLLDFRIRSIDCSISHDGDYATAVVVILEETS
ncbi:MAG: holo-ACP synthase [Nanoarchaeota archaeon]|nr:holo-ACP synthase [Nanoarchaeota archaeon]